VYRVHVFASTGRFSSLEQLRKFIDMTYSEEGDGMPSPFIREARIEGYEPGCIEAVISENGSSVPLVELLVGVSYADQWLARVPRTLHANAAVCVYAPNAVLSPRACSLEYVGEYQYDVV
jgi:hypothetical protein